MAFFCCDKNQDCAGLAIALSTIIGIITALVQITTIVTVTPVFFWVAFGIAVVYLAATLVVSALTQVTASCRGLSYILSVLLIGILGTILFAIVLLAVEFAATSIIGAIITGALLLFFSLMLITTACLAKCLVNRKN